MNLKPFLSLFIISKSVYITLYFIYILKISFKALSNEFDESNKSKFKINDIKNQLKHILFEVFPNLGNESDIMFVSKIKKDFTNYYNNKLKEISNMTGDSKLADKDTIYSKEIEDHLDFDFFNSKETLEYYFNFFDNLKEDEFTKVKIPYEKTIYGFFSNQEKIVNLFNSIIKIIEHIMNSRFGSSNLNQNIHNNQNGTNEKINIDYLSNKKDTDGYDMLVHEKEFIEANIKDNSNEKVKNIGKYDANNKYIIEKFYNPFIEKQKYRLALNENMGKIKKMTRSDALTNYNLNNKKVEIKKISNEILIYNNPSK